jgi:hypothetical protein
METNELFEEYKHILVDKPTLTTDEGKEWFHFIEVAVDNNILLDALKLQIEYYFNKYKDETRYTSLLIFNEFDDFFFGSNVSLVGFNSSDNFILLNKTNKSISIVPLMYLSDKYIINIVAGLRDYGIFNFKRELS